MTVTQIVNDLLDFNMITMEAATVLLKTEIKANMFDKQDKNTNQVFQSYRGVTNGNTSNPYHVSTTTNDTMMNATTTGLSTGANELLKVK